MDALSNVRELFGGKKLLLWGMGREGKSTEAFLTRNVPSACISTLNGIREDFNDADYDYIFKSPGIHTDEENPKFISQTWLFMRCFREQIIGVTGTKGKSTTSSMLAQVLRDCWAPKKPGRKVLLVGNIGEPALNHFEEVDENTLIVYELSCHQLDHLKYSPHVAVYLNLFEEHLDYYKTLQHYFEVKSNITLHQSAEDYFLVGDNVPAIPTAARTRVLSMQEAPEYELSVNGHHNCYNAHIAFLIATELYGCDADAVRRSLKSFTGLRHRLEFIGTKDGVSFYDDSISTIPQATIGALTSLPSAKTVLIGGMDRGIDYSLLEEFIPAHPEYNYILMYASGARIAAELKKTLKKRKLPENVVLVGTLADAVEEAKRVTKPGEACVLSPAAASYGFFRDFEERGEKFVGLVMG